MIPLQRAFHGPFKGVVGVMGTQMGKTDSTANIMGQRLDDDPAPIIYVGPTRHFVEKKWEPRFMAMVDSSASLAAKFDRGRADTRTQKRISGVNVSFAWAGSATSLAGDPAALVIVDERDRMESDVGGEGDPVEMANARHETYADGKTGVFSTPTTGTLETYTHPTTGLVHWKVGDQITSPVWQLWQQGTRHEFMWACPHCSASFAPRMALLQFPPDVEPGDLSTSNVKLACPHCGALIDETHKTVLNERGLDVSPGQSVVNGERVGNGVVSDWYTLWVSGLCSPWRSWVTSARRLMRAQREGSSEKIQTVINTAFGELYAISGEAPLLNQVAQLRDTYQLGEVPAHVHTVTMTVDVQQDRLYYTVRGWSVRRNMESWLLDYGTIEGATNEQEVWDALEQFKTRSYGSKRIKRCMIDQKYRTQYVLQFCIKHRGWACATAGRMPKTISAEAQTPLRTSTIEVDQKGKMKKGGRALKRWTINTDFFKRWVHDRIQLGDRGGFHLPIDATDEYCGQLVAEARVVKPSGKIEWVLLQKANHYLDCEQMQVACAYSLRLPHYAQPTKDAPTAAAKGDAPQAQSDTGAAAIEQDAEPPPPPEPPTPRPQAPARRSSGSGWMSRRSTRWFR
jgi:phage terminase large subunit GpA-like protein